MAQHQGEPISEAKKHLESADKQRASAAIDSWEPADPSGCVTQCFYAYENAVVAAAIAVGEPWEEVHWKKRDLAKKLFDDGHLATDVSDLLDRLNTLRKDVAYGEPSSDLARLDLEDLVSNLENFLSEVEEVVKAHGG